MDKYTLEYPHLLDYMGDVVLTFNDEVTTTWFAEKILAFIQETFNPEEV